MTYSDRYSDDPPQARIGSTLMWWDTADAEMNAEADITVALSGFELPSKPKLHRNTGPALVWDETELWYWRGVRMEKQEWLETNDTMTAEDKVIFKLKYF